MELIKKKLQQFDWEYFKKALVVLVVSCAVSIAVSMISYTYAEKKRVMNKGSQSYLNKMKFQYQDAVKQLEMVGLYNEDYSKLQQQGFIGDENRLDWVETLRIIAKKRQVATIGYKIKALKKYIPDYKLKTKLFQINTSEMVLQMKLLHERDLLDIFNDLNRRTAGVYDIKKCKLQIGGDEIIYEAQAVNIKAVCTLNWFTIQLLEKT